ncbi:hypothetical protein AB0J86_00160 [Micromonospora sp. NPDC049559]|uniref:hypothetical protein n=1 Tax=Micromonospora sp. NPDC049559 TaxID=3155923 RepID=UPI00343D6D2D
MARDYDTQLLESVAVRRRRLRDALLYGSLAIRRSYEENLGRAMAGVVVAAVLTGGCVGWSFVQHQIAVQQQQQREQLNPTVGPTGPGR